MEPLFNNPGYQPIIENIFLTLDHQSILQCRLVNQSWKKHVDKPIFWLKKCAQKKSENQDLWTRIIHAPKDELEDENYLENNIAQCLMKMNNLDQCAFQYPLHMACKMGDAKLAQFILENVNSPMYDEHGRTPIHLAAQNGTYFFS